MAKETCHAHSATANVSFPAWRNLIAPRLGQGVISTDMLSADAGNGDREFCDAWARRQHLSLTITTNNRRKVKEQEAGLLPHTRKDPQLAAEGGT